MNLTCERCGKNFDDATFRGYCDECKVFFQSVRDRVHKAQRPAPGICADGKFASDPPPQSFADPVSGKAVCGLCGSDQLESGYGLGTGLGIGSYHWCAGCNNFLDFVEDSDG